MTDMSSGTHERCKKTRSIQVSSVSQEALFAVGGMDLQEQSAVKDEARDQFRRTTRNVTVFGTSTAPKGTVSSIHQLSRDPARRVIIHQIEIYRA